MEAIMTHPFQRPQMVALLVVACTLVLTLGLATPSSGQATGSLELVAQSAWVDDGGIFDMQVRVAGADPDATVGVRVLPPWPERDDFLRLDLTSDLTPSFELEAVPLADMQTTSNEVIGFQIVVAGPNTDVDESVDGPIPILKTDGGSAVHPVEVSLYQADGTLLDRFVTSLIELPRGQRNAALQTAIVLEAQVHPTTQPNGQIVIDPDELDALETLVNAMAQHTDAEVALSISPETLVGLANSNDEQAIRVLEQLRSIENPQQFLPNPFSEVEEQAWVDVGLADELGELYDVGTAATNTIIGVEPDGSVMLLDRTLDPDGLAAITSPRASDTGAFGVEAVIVRPAQIEPLDRSIFPQALTTRFVIPTGDGRAVPALVADGGLANHFTNPGESAYKANRLLADLTMLSLQNSDVRQAVVVNPPVDWVPDAALLNVMLSGIERIPAIRGASPAEALAETAFTPERGISTLSPPLRRELNPRRQPTNLRSFRTEFSQARSAIDSWSAVISGDQASTNRLETLLQVSTDHRLTDTQRTNYIDAIYEIINGQKDSSITTPENDTITLTGRNSDIPITVENNLGVDANVLLILDSEKLAFPNGQSIEITLLPGPNRIDIPIEARASGDSPIRVQVFTPDRSVLLGSSEILVRTFAFSGVGIIIGALSLAVLLVWWLRHARSTRATIRANSSASEMPESTADTSNETEHIGV